MSYSYGYSDGPSISSQTSNTTPSHVRRLCGRNKNGNSTGPPKKFPQYPISYFLTKNREYQNLVGPCCTSLRPPPDPCKVYKAAFCSCCCSERDAVFNKPQKNYPSCCGPTHPPIPRLLQSPKYNTCPVTKSSARQQNACQAELNRLRNQCWREEERDVILQEKRYQGLIDSKYACQVRDWQICQEKLMTDCAHRKQLMAEIQCQREELRKVKEETRRWRRFQRLKYLEEKQKEQDIWVKEYNQRNEDRKLHEEKVRVTQDDKWLNAQTKPRDTDDMVFPELEELRATFVPVHNGPNETYEYFVIEPRPRTVEVLKQAEMNTLAAIKSRNKESSAGF